MKARSDQNQEKGIYCTTQELFFEGQKAKDINLRRLTKTSFILSGNKRTKIRGRGMEFFESRLYVPQDEMRAIDWKVSARFSKLFTKVFIEERDHPIYFVVDMRPSMFFGSRNCMKSVLAARIAARLSMAAKNSGDQVSGLVFDGEQELVSPLSNNLARWFGLLSNGTKHLSRHQTPSLGDNRLAEVLKRLIFRVRPGAQIFLLSDFLDMDESLRPLLSKLKSKAQLFALAVFDPLEERMATIGQVGMTFNGESVNFDSSNKILQKNYLTWWEAHQGKIASIFKAMNIPLIRFSTATPPDAVLKRFFFVRG